MATILVIEDEPPSRSIIETALRRAGHVVMAASNGLEAAALIGPSGKLDLVITDLFMPDMDGIEVMRAFQEHHPGVRIMVISGGGRFPSADSLRLAKRFGADEVLAKPFMLDRLVETVGRMLGNQAPLPERNALGEPPC